MKDGMHVILLVEDNRDFANLVQIYLTKYEEGKFSVIWRENGEAGLKEVESNPDIDVILMDYFLPKTNGLEVTRKLREKQYRLPVIFVTVNRDFDLAVEVMKLEVDDYLVKDEISTPVLPRTILNVLEKRKLQEHLTALEVSKHRLETMRKMVSEILKSITEPMVELEKGVGQFQSISSAKKYETYLAIIRDNLRRLTTKIELLKSLNNDKTVPYIKDIRMIDLS